VAKNIKNVMERKTIIRCRGIILNEEKLLVVKHDKDFDYYAFPGGHLEWKENPKECLEREIMEEFGIKPIIGRLLYIHTFVKKEEYFIEFFFEITNGKDYLNVKELNGSHSQELFDVLWVDKNQNIKILPEKIYEDFNNGVLLSDSVKFI